MQRRDTLDLGSAARREFGRLRDAHARLAQIHHTAVLRMVRLAAGVPPFPLRDVNAPTLPLAPVLVVVARSLRRHPQQRLLHRLEHDARHARAAGHQ